MHQHHHKTYSLMLGDGVLVVEVEDLNVGAKTIAFLLIFTCCELVLHDHALVVEIQ